MRFSKVCLQAFGYALPPVNLTSTALEEELSPLYSRLSLPQGRLELMTGIRSRRLWDQGTRPSQAAAMAGEQAIAASGIGKNDLGCLLFTSVSRDMLEPSTASFVHRQLGLPQCCQVFDISNACLGFLNGMVMLAGMIELGQVKSGLVVAGETAEDLVHSTIRLLQTDQTISRKSIKPLFASLTIGSGAVALVLTSDTFSDSGHYLRGGACRANTEYNHLCQGGQNAEQGVLMSTDSEELLIRGVETARDCWDDFLQELAWQPETVDRFFCHQVGRAHAHLLFSSLKLDPARNFETLAELGNVGSVSAPITMALGIERGYLQPGQRCALLGIGSGINTMMLGIDW
ncbi:MAG: 3-oxoacyl-ACP synthase III [Desulfobulbus propionicus]|nr:MAG: 3-oxoacyl-ACP synthase III [Desulfobulbus propionicus]